MIGLDWLIFHARFICKGENLALASTTHSYKNNEET